MVTLVHGTSIVVPYPDLLQPPMPNVHGIAHVHVVSMDLGTRLIQVWERDYFHLLDVHHLTNHRRKN